MNPKRDLNSDTPGKILEDFSEIQEQKVGNQNRKFSEKIHKPKMDLNSNTPGNMLDVFSEIQEQKLEIRTVNLLRKSINSKWI